MPLNLPPKPNASRLREMLPQTAQITFEEGLDLGQTELQSVYWFLFYFVPLPLTTCASILNSI